MNHCPYSNYIHPDYVKHDFTISSKISSLFARVRNVLGYWIFSNILGRMFRRLISVVYTSFLLLFTNALVCLWVSSLPFMGWLLPYHVMVFGFVPIFEPIGMVFSALGLSHIVSWLFRLGRRIILPDEKPRISSISGRFVRSEFTGWIIDRLCCITGMIVIYHSYKALQRAWVKYRQGEGRNEPTKESNNTFRSEIDLIALLRKGTVLMEWVNTTIAIICEAYNDLSPMRELLSDRHKKTLMGGLRRDFKIQPRVFESKSAVTDVLEGDCIFTGSFPVNCKIKRLDFKDKISMGDVEILLRRYSEYQFETNQCATICKNCAGYYRGRKLLKIETPASETCVLDVVCVSTPEMEHNGNLCVCVSDPADWYRHPGVYIVGNFARIAHAAPPQTLKYTPEVQKYVDDVGLVSDDSAEQFAFSDEDFEVPEPPTDLKSTILSKIDRAILVVTTVCTDEKMIYFCGIVFVVMSIAAILTIWPKISIDWMNQYYFCWAGLYNNLKAKVFGGAILEGKRKKVSQNKLKWDPAIYNDDEAKALRGKYKGRELDEHMNELMHRKKFRLDKYMNEEEAEEWDRKRVARASHLADEHYYNNNLVHVMSSRSNDFLGGDGDDKWVHLGSKKHPKGSRPGPVDIDSWSDNYSHRWESKETATKVANHWIKHHCGGLHDVTFIENVCKHRQEESTVKQVVRRVGSELPKQCEIPMCEGKMKCSKDCKGWLRLKGGGLYCECLIRKAGDIVVWQKPITLKQAVAPVIEQKVEVGPTNDDIWEKMKSMNDGLLKYIIALDKKIESQKPVDVEKVIQKSLAQQRKQLAQETEAKTHNSELEALKKQLISAEAENKTLKAKPALDAEVEKANAEIERLRKENEALQKPKVDPELEKVKAKLKKAKEANKALKAKPENPELEKAKAELARLEKENATLKEKVKPPVAKPEKKKGKRQNVCPHGKNCKRVDEGHRFLYHSDELAKICPHVKCDTKDPHHNAKYHPERLEGNVGAEPAVSVADVLKRTETQCFAYSKDVLGPEVDSSKALGSVTFVTVDLVPWAICNWHFFQSGDIGVAHNTHKLPDSINQNLIRLNKKDAIQSKHNSDLCFVRVTDAESIKKVNFLKKNRMVTWNPDSTSFTCFGFDPKDFVSPVASQSSTVVDKSTDDNVSIAGKYTTTLGSCGSQIYVKGEWVGVHYLFDGKNYNHFIPFTSDVMSEFKQLSKPAKAKSVVEEVTSMHWADM